MSTKRIAFLGWLLRQSGKVALWGQKGPDLFDCSGLVTRGYVEVGVDCFDPLFTNTDKLWKELEPVEAPAPGDLVFYGGERPDDVEHVMVFWGGGLVLGACGATPKIRTAQMAREKGARVRLRRLHYMPRLRGYRRSPFESSPQGKAVV
jgi:cell wall-associated NlpC family hydrolase